ncbi:hypothetical protein [Streptomyces phaeoluteigriseus]
MANFLDDQTDTKRLARLLNEYDGRLRALERSTQASYTSIEGGALDIYDDEGVLKGSVGVQPDGTVALVPVNTTPPPTPTTPTVEPVLAGLLVGWDGQWDDSYTTPADFSLVQVHVGQAAGFTPDLTTQAATISAALGGTETIAIEGYASVWVRLVGQNAAAVTGRASVAVQAQPRQAVSQDLVDGIVTETKLAAQAVSEAKVALGAIKIPALGGALADSATQRFIDTMTDPGAWQVTAQGTGATWGLLSNVTDAPTGRGSVGQAQGFVRVRGTALIPYEPGTLYRISARIRLTAPLTGTESCFVGVLGVAGDGVTLVNRNGENSPSMHNYCAASGRLLASTDGFVTVIGFLKDRAPSGQVGTAGPNSDPRSPGQVHANTRFITPYVWLNYSSEMVPNSGSTMQVDAVTIEALKVGVVDPINLAANAVTAAAIAANAITAEKILAGAVTTEKLVALSVTSEKIASLAITTEKLAALAVTADQLAANSVTATKIVAGVIDATHIKAGAISADRLALGTDGNLIADPSFEGAVSDQRVTGNTWWSIATPGNGTPRALQVDAANATVATRSMTLATLPAVPGQKLWLSVDYLASADWNGVRVGLYGQWLDAAGNVLGSSAVTTGDGLAVKGTWTTLSGVPDVAAPTGTVQLRVVCSTDDSNAGTVRYDNASCRIVLASGVAGARAEISPRGLQLFDDDGDEAVALVTGRPNYLTLSANGVPVATIDQLGNAGFGDLAVAGRLSVGGDSLEGLLTGAPRGIIAVSKQYNTTVTAATTDYGYVELAFEADVTREYRVVWDVYANPSAAGGELVMSIKDAGASAPTLTSPQIQSGVYPTPTAGLRRVRMELLRSGAQFGAGLHRLLTAFRISGGPSGQTVALSTGGGWPGLFYVEDVGPVLPDTGVFNTGGGTAVPVKKTYTKTYGAIWSGSYASRGAYNSYYGNQMMCGYYSSTNGVQASLVGFNAQLATDLSGATIAKAEVYLYFDHWYSNAGGTAVIKAHKHASRPSTFVRRCRSEVGGVETK